MKVLIACEKSQRVCISFRHLGHEAYSCDVQPCSGGYPEWHIHSDVESVLNDKWDLIIAHPPCTFLTVTGNRWFNVERYGDAARNRFFEREKAIDFFMKIVNADCEKIAIENPVGIMSTVYRKPDQIIHPYFFGDPYEKRTCLWLKNLPFLKKTKEVTPEPRVKTGKKTMPAWYAKLWGLPGDKRSELRSVTFWGVARAMADQWGV